MIRSIAFVIGIGALMSTWQVRAAEWASINRNENISVSAVGDVFSSEGATLKIESRSDSKPGGAITSVPADPYIGRSIAFEGKITSTESIRSSGIWLRVDGDGGPLVFRTTEGTPVRGGESKATRKIEVTIPIKAKRIVFGVSVSGTGTLELSDLLFSDSVASAKQVDYQEMMLDALTRAEANAYFGERVRWDQLRKQSENIAASEYEAHRFISNALKQLNDGHSRLVPASSATNEHDFDPGNVKVSVTDGVGYVFVPSTAGLSRAGRDSYAKSICSRLIALNSQAPLGWLVDLRGNGGGNMWPMLQALKPLLGRDEAGRMVTKDGTETPWDIRDVAGCSADLSSTPVAVLFNNTTASAAEAVAIAFRGRNSTRSFGAQTAGQANANRSFDLIDGSILLVTSALYKDRHGHLYADSIILPDEAIGAPASKNDAVLVSGSSWLRSLRE